MLSPPPLGLVQPAASAVSAVSAATGETLHVFEGTRGTEEVLCHEGILLLVVRSVTDERIAELKKWEELAKKNKYCPAVHEQLVMDPHNKIYGCPLLMEDPVGEFVDGKIELHGDICGGRRDCCLTDII